jgi:hypothetical protein
MQGANMPQSTKDSKGGKTTGSKPSHAKSSASEKSIKKATAKGGSSGSPTGPMRHGEKKTTP